MQGSKNGVEPSRPNFWGWMVFILVIVAILIAWIALHFWAYQVFQGGDVRWHRNSEGLEEPSTNFLANLILFDLVFVMGALWRLAHYARGRQKEA